jgi:hypothetical protein
MARKRRELEAVSISFLDVITCGFGAIVLLLTISKIGVPAVVEPVPSADPGMIAALQQQLFDIRGEAKILNRELNAKREQVSKYKEQVARLDSKLKDEGPEQDQAAKDAAAAAELEDELLVAKQSLTDEMRRLLERSRQPRSGLVGGVPIDSEYIIFVIDTSGSMFQYAWGTMIKTMIQTLNAYPKVKGLQIMSDEGQYMFTQYRGRWIPDTPARRNAIVQRLRTWNVFSNSSPVEGIAEAIRTFYSPDRKISVYVLGDDFTGPSIEQALRMIDTLNRRAGDGSRRVRIHGIGFPVQFHAPQSTQAYKFAALMREMARRNDGTFFAVHEIDR